MKLIFADTDVRDLCCCRKNLVERFSVEFAKKICSRLSMLAAASSLAEIPVSLPIGLSPVDEHEMFSVALGIDHRLLFQIASANAAHAHDLSKVLKIRIIGPIPVPAARGKRK